MTVSSTNPVLRVGVIGCGEVSQVIHIPTIGFLSDYFRITYLCDVSEAALEHCQKKVVGPMPKTTRNAAELCAAAEVDVVLVASSDEYHAEQAITALQQNKYVLIEKPMALNQRDARAIIEAEKKSTGQVMVGYMRRYAPAFEDTVKEVGSMDCILYARVRDIIGPNSAFVSQSGTFPKQFVDFDGEDIAAKAMKAVEMVSQGLSECGIEVTDDTTRMWKLLGSLGSHDLSAMRELLGMPSGVIGAFLGNTFWNALFQYPGYCVNYESGIDSIPRFDAHLEVYSEKKSVRVQYDTPYVKGLPVTVCVRENDGGVYRETSIRKTYEDPYTVEFRAFYDFVQHGKAVKSTAEDAEKDLLMFQMIMKAAKKELP